MDNFVLIKKDVLPKSFLDVLAAKKMIEEGISISEACKKCDISRSTFYKYSKSIFEGQVKNEKKAHIIVKAYNNKGVLASLLQIIASRGGNVISISQSAPIHELAIINMIIDYMNIIDSLEDVITQIKNVESVKNVEILSLE